LISPSKLTELTETQHPIFTAVKHNACRKDLTSDESLSFVRDKLRMCIDRHPSCQNHADDLVYMPKRVLDLGVVGNENREVHLRAPVRLVESINLTGDRTYACLSHRWDSSGRTIITEQATYEKHRNGLRFEDLDLAYQETVYIMRQLAMRYLWVDSLCIIQDDTEDWEVESKKMSMVYNRALFTIARQCESNTSLRCLPDLSHRVSDLYISPPIYARPTIKHMWEGDVFPLSKRGWVYQERLLSPRTIHFSDQEISWECYEISTCQCAVELKYGDYYNDSIPKIYHAEALCLKTRTLKPETSALRQRWRQIVEEYSCLRLTNPSDRLHAVRGCAEQIREHLKESYHFGLWQGDLVGDMAWRACTPSPRPTCQHSTPTWSWASTSAGVDYVRLTEIQSHAQLAMDPANDGTCSTQAPITMLLTGQLIPAYLKIGRSSGIHDHTFAQDRIEIEVNSAYLRECPKSVRLSCPSHILYHDFEMRTDDWDSEERYDIGILLLGLIHAGSMSWHYCLILWRYGRGIPGSGQERETFDKHPIYQRIGIARFDPQDLLWTPQGKPFLDWSKVDRVTVAIE
jgi:hypothetical protein